MKKRRNATHERSTVPVVGSIILLLLLAFQFGLFLMGAVGKCRSEASRWYTYLPFQILGSHTLGITGKERGHANIGQS